jgi:P4 family phage/plasmid primase-like protien
MHEALQDTVFLDYIIKDYEESVGVQGICKDVEKLIKDIASATMVREVVGGFELQSFTGRPRVEWKGDTVHLRAYIGEMALTGQIKVKSLDEIGNAALCLNRILSWYLGRKQPASDPLAALEELAGRVSIKEKEEIIMKLTHVIEESHHIIYYNGDLLCFNGRVYVECEDDLRREIERLADAYKMSPKITRYIVNETLAKIARRRYVRPEEIKGSHYTLAFQNGLVDVVDFIQRGFIEVKPFSPDVFVEHEIPHKIDASVSTFVRREYKLEAYSDTIIDIVHLAENVAPFYARVFSDWVEEKNVPLLFEIIGYTFLKDYPIHKAFMLVGDGSNGKSTYLGLVKHILGTRNVVAVPLQTLADPNDRFSRALLYKKLAVIYPDIPKRPLKDTGMFKALTGEDLITADRKYKEPITFKNYAKLLYSANELPEVNDQTFAFWRRWEIAEFPNQFETNPKFKHELLTNPQLPKLIAVSLYALRNVMIRRAFTTSEDARDKWMRKANNIYAFLKDLLDGKIDGVRAEENPNAKVKTSELYSLYVTYCNDRDLKPKAKATFTRELEKMGYPKVKVHGEYYYKGLKVIIEEGQGEGILKY